MLLFNYLYRKYTVLDKRINLINGGLSLRLCNLILILTNVHACMIHEVGLYIGMYREYIF